MPLFSPHRSAPSSEAPAPGAALAVNPVNLVWPLALWLAVVGNLPLWQRVIGLASQPAQALGLVLAMGGLVLGITAALLSLLAWPRLLRPLASLLVLVAAFNSYFMWQYGVVIDPTMMANVATTDAREVRDLLSLPLLGTLLGVAGPALWWIWRRPPARRRFLPQSLRNAGGMAAGLVLAVGVTLAGYQGLASLMRNHKDLRYMINPLNSVYAATRLAADQLPKKARTLQPVGEDAKLGARYAQQKRPPLLVVVVGETARAQNWGLNGYARANTPVLAQWQAKGLVNFPDVRSCGTNTQVSVPCIFSPLTREQGGDQTAEHQNLLDVLQRAGLAVLWLDNQSASTTDAFSL